MDLEEAAAHLEVGAAAPADVVRRAFRRLVVRHHPDLTGSADTSHVRRLTEAYRVLSAHAAGTTAAPPTAPVERIIASAGDDTLSFDLPPDESFDHLLDAAAAIGDVTYADPEAGLLEVVVDFDDGRRASAVLSLQGRATGVTDAFVTVEPRDGRPPPPAEAVVRAFVQELG